jgi:hypothetical protein
MGGWWFFGFLMLCLAIGIPLSVHMMRSDDRRRHEPAPGQSTPLNPTEVRRQSPGERHRFREPDGGGLVDGAWVWLALTTSRRPTSGQGLLDAALKVMNSGLYALRRPS